MLNKIRSIGITEEIPIAQRKKIRIVNNGAFYGLVILLAYALFNAYLGYRQLVYINLAFAATASIMLLLNAKRQYNFAVYVLLLISPLHILSFAWFVGEIGAEYYIILFIAIGIYVVDNKKILNLITVYLILCFVAAKVILYFKTYPAEYQMLESWYYYPNLMLFVFLIIVVGYIFKFNTVKYQEVIEEQKEALAKQVDELDKGKQLLSNLLRELNHRVKNNLQMVSGLLSIQSRNSAQLETKQKLSDAVTRIDSLVLLHQQLYKNPEDSNPNIKVYIEKLADHIVYASGSEDILCVNKKIDNFTMPIDFAIYIGLIVNELITNALKYGIDNTNKNNVISISLSKNSTFISIKVSDTGKGFSDSFNIKNVKTGGLDLVNSIAQKYQGNIVIEDSKRGASVIVKLHCAE